MININPLAVKAPATAASNPLAVKTAAPASAAPNDPAMTQAIQQSLNNVVGYYQPQTPQEKAYADELAKYVGGLDAQYGSYGATRLTGDRLAQLPFGGPQLYKAPTAEQISSYYGMSPEQNTFYSFNLPSNKGNRTGEVNVSYNTPVALYDYRDGKLLYSGVGFDAAEKVAEMARNLSETQGRKAEWGIFTGAPGSTDLSTFKQAAYEKPNQSTLGKIADIGLPTLGAILTGGTLAPLGAAAGSAASSVAQGRSLKDTLLRAGISGLTTYGMGQLTGAAPISSAPASVAGESAGSAAAQAVAQQGAQKAIENAAGEIVVTAFPKVASGLLSPSFAGALGASIGGISGAGIPSSTPSAPDFNNLPVDAETLVTAGWRPTGGLSGVGSAAGAGAGAGAGALTQQPNEPGVTDNGEEITVTGGNVQPPNWDAINAAVSGGAGAVPTEPITKPQEVGDAEEEILVKANKKALIDFGLPPSFVAGLTAAELSTLAARFGVEPKAEGTGGGGGLSVPDWLKYGGLGLSALSALSKALAGNGGGGGATTPGVTSPVFTAKLPEAGAGFGGTGGGSFAARPVSTSGGTGTGGAMTMEDWLTYGTRPERSFFSYVPESNAVVGKAMGGYAAGGRRKSFAVEGEGTGRSDDIPAVLSDGEYVIDAETVALLGDGSSKAGAKKLDEFRVNVRKHKGAKLAKGRFSANAKRPEKYLAGGKA